MPHPPSVQPDHSRKVNAVIDNPHITDWFFTSKLADWVQHWLYGCLDAEWHWHRFEYQARGSAHAHGCAKLNNYPGLCSLIEKAALAWSLSEHSSNTNQSIPADEFYKKVRKQNHTLSAA
jgi:hypothetical protein